MSVHFSRSSGHYSDRFVNGQSDEKKVKKKKKSKTQAHGEDVNTDAPPLVAEENADAKPSQIRTFPSGLSIEELEAGKPDGKIATSGKKARLFESVVDLFHTDSDFKFVCLYLTFQCIMVA